LTAKLALAMVVLALFPAAASAAEFDVTTGSDGNAACTVITCTLRSALAASNANDVNEDDVIVLPARAYSLNSQFGALALAASQRRVLIRGAGANSTFIEPLSGYTNPVLTVPSGAQVTLSDLTLRGARVTSSAGGDLRAQGDSSVTLQRVRVTDGQAPQGGGIATAGGGNVTTLNIAQSLIDGNTATGATLGAAGGGLYIAGATFPATVTVTDSTIFNNSARTGAGVFVSFNGAAPPAFRGVTIADNKARQGTDGTGIGGVVSSSATVRFQGSIVTRNTATANTGTTSTSNCSIAPAATDEGSNVTPASDCGLGGSHADPLLSAALDDTQQPPVLTLPADSPAVDIADCAGRTLDQRGVARPQLKTCDAGAYEYQPPPPEPTPTPTATPTATAVPTATPTATPPPVRNQSVAAKPEGTVLVKRPGSTKFVPLDPSLIRNGSEVDARKGRVEITTSTNEKAVFYDGIFKVSQSHGITTLTLTEKLAPCPSKKARAAARKPKTRKLWGDGKGKFRTKGQYSAATIRGTKWLVQDGCRFTRTTVSTGTVNVRDDVKKTTIVLRRGKSYTARSRR